MDEYIKRSDIINDLLESADGVESTPSWHDLFMELAEKYKKFPAADVAPVVHGKWIVVQTFDDCVYAKCSNCDVTQIFYHNKPLTKFCPDCGAKMDL